MRVPAPLVMPEAVVRILRRLEEAGHETWCVGGAIRDGLLGSPGSDVDLATAATPDVVRRLFPRTIPVGIEHGTVGVLDDEGVLHEVTTFRQDVRTDGRRAEVVFGVTLEDDLARRDFTINAIAYHPLRDVWADPFGGREDLARGVVRAVGEVAQRFREDRLRILRALRFAARFGFAIDDATWAAVVEQGRDTGHLSAERVREEWWKGVATTRDLGTLARLWDESGVAATWVPVERAVSVAEPAALSALTPRRDPVLALAAWRGSIEAHLKRLKCSAADIARGRAIDRAVARPVDASPVKVRQWLAAVGQAADDLIALATWRGAVTDGWPDVVAGVRARGEATTRAQLAVTGDDLVRAGLVVPGPALGRLLERLLDLVLEDPARNGYDALMRAAADVAD
jgi:tRNA nucleotidyltransferase (CCA-adding enzyme)